MKLKIFLLICVSFCCFIYIYGQDRKITDSLWTAFNQAKHDTTKIKILNDGIGYLYENISPDSAIMFYNQAISIANKVLGSGTASSAKPRTTQYRIFSLKAASIRNIGFVHYKQGNYDKAIGDFLKSLNIYEGLRSDKGILASYYYIGLVYSDMHSFDKATEYILKSLEISEKTGKKDFTSSNLNALGNIQYVTGNYDKAIEYYSKVLKLNEENNNINGLALGYMNIGNVNNDLCMNASDQKKRSESYTKAVEYYSKALKIMQELGDKTNMILIYSNISRLHLVMASPSLQQNINTDEFHKKPESVAHLDSAMAYGMKAYKLAKETKSSSFVYQVANIIKTIYCDKGDFKNAYEFAEISLQTKDTIFSEEKTKALTEMSTRYESEKKQLQIDKLSKEKELQNETIARKVAESKKQRILIFSFMAGFIIILVFSVFLYRLFIQKKKANILIALKNQSLEIAYNEINSQKEEITAQRDEITVQRDLVTEQKDFIAGQKKEITDSINYAKRIQQAVLPSGEYADAILGEHFIFFKPKDIVSGDFYWGTRINDLLIVTVADCTGHGVPGAFMSMLGVSFLNEIVRKKEITKASEVLDHLRDSIIEALQQKGTSGEQKDGMDIALCVINVITRQMQFAGANNPLFIVSVQKELIEVPPDKMPVAIHEYMEKFINHAYQLQKGDCIYLCSDGYEDQFGGVNNKKFMSKQLKELLVNISGIPMNEQHEILNTTFEDWRGKHEQIDDVTILGLRV